MLRRPSLFHLDCLTFTIALLLPFAVPLGTRAQTNVKSLQSYSREQLIACMNKPGDCHARDIYEVEAEIDARLPEMQTADLVRCYTDWRVCGDSEPWAISDILRKRGQTDNVLRQYGPTNDWSIRGGLETLAYNSSSPLAAEYMRTSFAQRLDDGDNLYWPAMYLAKHCDTDALRYLDPGPNSRSIADKFSVSSAQFAETAALFGKCRYRPSIPYLVVIGMHAASLNLVDAASKSLHRFYPHPPKFNSLEAEQRYFCERANRDGFHLD